MRMASPIGFASPAVTAFLRKNQLCLLPGEVSTTSEARPLRSQLAALPLSASLSSTRAKTNAVCSMPPRLPRGVCSEIVRPST